MRASVLAACVLVPAIAEAAGPRPRVVPAPGAPSVSHRDSGKVSIRRIALGSRRGTAATLSFKVAILAEGYTDEAPFLADARRLIEQVRDDEAGHQLLAMRHFEFVLVFTASREAASLAGPRRTRLGASASSDGAIQLTRGGKDAVRSLLAAVPGRTTDAHVVLACFGDEDFGVEGKTSRANADFPDEGAEIRISPRSRSFVHELGHALYGLADEYGDDHPRRSPPEALRKIRARCFNVTFEKDSTRWRWWTADRPRAGGLGYGEGAWHPFEHCRMNESVSQKFCDACWQAMLFDTYDREHGRGHEVPKVAFLDPRAAKTDAISMSVVFTSERSALRFAPNTPFTLRWTCHAGVVPRRVVVVGYVVTADRPGREEIMPRTSIGDGRSPLRFTEFPFELGLPALEDRVVGGRRFERTYELDIFADEYPYPWRVRLRVAND